MTARLVVLSLFAVTPVFAQPGARPAAADDMAAFEKDLDALFVSGGLTSEQAAARAPRVSPDVQRRAAELDAAVASAQAVELARVPQVGATASYARLSRIDPIMFVPGMPA